MKVIPGLFLKISRAFFVTSTYVIFTCNEGMEFIDLRSIFRDKSIVSSILA